MFKLQSSKNNSELQSSSSQN